MSFAYNVSFSISKNNNNNLKVHTLTVCLKYKLKKVFAVVLVCVCATTKAYNVSVFSLLLISGILKAWFCFFFSKKCHLYSDSFLQICFYIWVLPIYCSYFILIHKHTYLKIEKANISLLSACFSLKQFLKHDSSAL